MRRKILFTLITIITLTFSVNSAYAGFGISPPYVKTLKPLFPGSHYEQKITLLRSSAEDDLKAQITINAPEVASWISIDKGETFDLPQGELQVPMVVRVDVPKDVALGNYKGNINVRIAPKEQGAGVAIALGARLDIDLNISNESFSDFTVRAIAIPDLEYLKKPWSWPIFSYFFYKIKIITKIENAGNVDTAPTKIQLDIYDAAEKNKLESSVTSKYNKVKPFSTDDISAYFKTNLLPGQYWGKVSVYKDNQIVRNDKLVFTIAKPGTLPGYNAHLGPWPYLMMAGLILLILAMIFLLIRIKFWKYLYKLLLVILWPLSYLWRKLLVLKNMIVNKFWKWIHKKSAEKQISKDENNKN